MNIDNYDEIDSLLIFASFQMTSNLFFCNLSIYDPSSLSWDDSTRTQVVGLQPKNIESRPFRVAPVPLGQPLAARQRPTALGASVVDPGGG